MDFLGVSSIMDWSASRAQLGGNILTDFLIYVQFKGKTVRILTSVHLSISVPIEIQVPGGEIKIPRATA